MANPAPPDFLALGHIAKDLSPEGYRVGGAVVYAALTALGMGLNPAVVTSVGPDLDLRSILAGVPVHTVPAGETTTFRNSYHEDVRTQLLTAVGAPITASDVPRCWVDAPLVLLGSLTGELDAELARGFPNAIVVASIQGWLRRWDNTGRVTPTPWEGTAVLPHVDAAICSVDDIGDVRLVNRWKDMVAVLIVTEGKAGARLHLDGGWHHVDAFPAREVDPTGAGDVFAAAFLIRYRETQDPLESARFASGAASFCVEAEGVDGIPTRAQVHQRLETRRR